MVEIEENGQKVTMPRDVFRFNHVSPFSLNVASELFFPDFVLCEGGVFLEISFTRELFYDLKAWNYALQDIELRMKALHLWDVLGNTSYKNTDEVIRDTARIMAFSWRLLLSERFPQRQVQVFFARMRAIVPFHSVRYEKASLTWQRRGGIMS